MGIHQGTGSATTKIWRSGDPPGDWLRYEGDLEILRLAPLPRRSGESWRSGDLGVWRFEGLEIWRSGYLEILGSGDPSQDWLRYQGDLEI